MLTSIALAAHVGGMGFGFGWLFFLVPLFWIGVVILIVSLARRRHGGWGPGRMAGHPYWSASRSAESTLAERFAQGDIDEKEYRARLEVLRANNSFGPQGK